MKPFVLCHANSKCPIGDDWGNHTIDAEELQRVLVRKPRLNVGILLGPASGVVDVECDSDEARKHFAELFGDVQTPSWTSRRGCHYLFQYDVRLQSLPATVKLASGLEFRLGNGKQTQSLIPQSRTDGFQREWLIPFGAAAALPEHVFGLLNPPIRTRRATVKRTVRRATTMFGGKIDFNCLVRH